MGRGQGRRRRGHGREADADNNTTSTSRPWYETNHASLNTTTAGQDATALVPWATDEDGEDYGWWGDAVGSYGQVDTGPALEDIEPVDLDSLSEHGRRLVESLSELTALDAPSRAETPVSEYLLDRWYPAFVRTGHGEHSFFHDHNGSLIARLDSGKPGPCVVVDAHIDEVGRKARAPLGCLRGTTTLVAKSMDNRSSVAVVDLLAQRLRPTHGRLYLVGSTCEEIGMMGAVSAAEGIRYLEEEHGGVIDMALVLDAARVPNTFCEYPGEKHTFGLGPIIGSLDPRDVKGKPGIWEADLDDPHQRSLEAALRTAAEHYQLSYQRAPLGTKLGLTNGNAYSQHSRAVITVQIPCLGMHSAHEQIDHRDLATTYQIMKRTLADVVGAVDTEVAD